MESGDGWEEETVDDTFHLDDSEIGQLVIWGTSVALSGYIDNVKSLVS